MTFAENPILLVVSISFGVSLGAFLWLFLRLHDKVKHEEHKTGDKCSDGAYR